MIAVLASVEWYAADEIPASLAEKTTVVKVPGDGGCFWSALWLACRATPTEVFAWWRRPRNSSGFPNSSDYTVEKGMVEMWAMSLPNIPDFVKKRIKMKYSAEKEDMVF